MFKPSNKAIAAKVMVLSDTLIRDLLELLGYIPVEEDYMYIGAEYALLMHLAHNIET